MRALVFIRVSSSPENSMTMSRRGRNPSRFSSIREAMASVPSSFMSAEPRPNNSPFSTTGVNGSRFQSAGLACTTSMWPEMTSGPSLGSEPRQRAIR